MLFCLSNYIARKKKNLNIKITMSKEYIFNLIYKIVICMFVIQTLRFCWYLMLGCGILLTTHNVEKCTEVAKEVGISYEEVIQVGTSLTVKGAFWVIVLCIIDLILIVDYNKKGIIYKFFSKVIERFIK